MEQIRSEDYQLMLQMLGIEKEELRLGPSAYPGNPDAANTDESKASPYTTLPDPLVFDDGSPVRTPEDWNQRKIEIFEAFDREIYGRMPESTPAVNWEIVEETTTTVGEYPAINQRLLGRVDNSSYPAISVGIDMILTLPKDAKGAVPVILEFGWGFTPPDSDEPSWQEQVLAKGWGYAVLIPTSVQADHGAGLREGIIGLVNKGKPRKLDDWGALRAWAWGASRALDYFESIPEVDTSRVAIEGLSRYGKAALVAMAYDDRFAVGCIGSSGAGGAKILRRVFGEQVEDLASYREYHWFAPNFIKYAGPLTPLDMPVDAHELIALCAPRPVFISVGSPEVEGQWGDARGMFIAAAQAAPVYELLGKHGLGTDTFPPMETSLTDGEIAFRQHRAGHTVGPNWPTFLKYAERYIGK